MSLDPTYDFDADPEWETVVWAGLLWTRRKSEGPFPPAPVCVWIAEDEQSKEQ